jgi:hypothetical protein
MKAQPPLMSHSEADNAWHLGNERLFGTKSTTTLAIEQEIATLQSQLARQKQIDTMQSSSSPARNLPQMHSYLMWSMMTRQDGKPFTRLLKGSVLGVTRMTTSAYLWPRQSSKTMRTNNCATTSPTNLPAPPTRRSKVNCRLVLNRHALSQLLVQLRSTSPVPNPELQTTSWLTQAHLMSYYVNNIWIFSPISKCLVPHNHRLQSYVHPTAKTCIQSEEACLPYEPSP